MEKVTVSIKKLKDEGLLSEGPFTHQEIVRAAATYVMIHNDDIHNSNDLYNLLWDECTAELAISLNEMDIDALYEEASHLGREMA